MICEHLNHRVSELATATVENFERRRVVCCRIVDSCGDCLVGPCEHSDVIGQALWQALEDAGVADPQTKFFHIGVPLRANQR